MYAKINRCLLICPFYGGCPHFEESVKRGSTVRMYMYSMVDTYSFVASTYVRPSVTEPGNEGYRRIYSLKNFRRYAQTTKILLHEKRTPEKFTTRKFPDLRYMYVCV